MNFNAAFEAGVLRGLGRDDAIHRYGAARDGIPGAGT
jgi:hypothetical protein